MTAINYDIRIENNASYQLRLTLYDDNNDLVDLTSYTAKFQIRPKLKSNIILLSLTESTGITLGGAAGTINIIRTKEQTELYTFENGVYDITITSPAGVTTRLIEGLAIISQGVSF